MYTGSNNLSNKNGEYLHSYLDWDATTDVLVLVNTSYTSLRFWTLVYQGQ